MLLSGEAVPYRYVYDLADGWSKQALAILHPVIGPELARKHALDGGVGTRFIEQMRQAGQFELYCSGYIDVDRVASPPR